MPFDHDAFIASRKYRDLDASLQWYMAAMRTRLGILEALARVNPTKAKALYQRDPVLRKIHRIEDVMTKFKNAARAEG